MKNVKTMKRYRQGDVMIKGIAAAPSGERKRRADGVILVGESTGHAHRLADLDAAELYEVGGKMYLSVTDAGVSIVHEEHLPIHLPAGEYEVLRQREYSPTEIRNVMD